MALPQATLGLAIGSQLNLKSKSNRGPPPRSVPVSMAAPWLHHGCTRAREDTRFAVVLGPLVDHPAWQLVSRPILCLPCPVPVLISHPRRGLRLDPFRFHRAAPGSFYRARSVVIISTHTRHHTLEPPCCLALASDSVCIRHKRITRRSCSVQRTSARGASIMDVAGRAVCCSSPSVGLVLVALWKVRFELCRYHIPVVKECNRDKYHQLCSKDLKSYASREYGAR